MRHSEIFAALSQTYGSDYGYALACDLALSALGGKTLNEALAANIEPERAWSAFCDEMQAPDSVRFHHRYSPRR